MADQPVVQPPPVSPGEFWEQYNTADALFVVDSDQRILHWSDNVEHLLAQIPRSKILSLVSTHWSNSVSVIY